MRLSDRAVRRCPAGISDSLVPGHTRVNADPAGGDLPDPRGSGMLSGNETGLERAGWGRGCQASRVLPLGPWEGMRYR